MRSIPLPEDRFASTGITFSQVEGSSIATFTYPRPDDKKPVHSVSVVCDGSTLRFFPERSAAQATLLKDLGLSAL